MEYSLLSGEIHSGYQIWYCTNHIKITFYFGNKLFFIYCKIKIDFNQHTREGKPMDTQEILLCKTYNDMNKNIIIGLTGRTGVGCSTVASVLSTKSFEELKLRKPDSRKFENSEKRKYKIIYEYFGKENGTKWVPFKVLKISNVILQIILENGLNEFITYIDNLNNINLYIDNKAKLIEKLKNLNEYFDNAKRYREELNRLSAFSYIDAVRGDASAKREELEKFYLNDIPQYRKSIEDIMRNYTCHNIRISKKEGKKQERNDLLKILLQYIGNNIRRSGNPYNNREFEKENEYLYTTIDLIIKCIIANNDIKKKVTRICVDAIRNPFESLFLKRRYANFYLFSVNAEESIRIGRLEKKNLSYEEICNLDHIECPMKLNGQELFYHQDVNGCIEKADVHLDNSREEDTKFYLTEQIVKYVALMNHPGLVMPSPMERCMQVAHNARLNSGCLSRQVGSVITDEFFSVKAIGWNEVPEGQVSCALRDIRNYKDKDEESYSRYELIDVGFEKTINRLCKMKDGKPLFGLPLPYCFKDIKIGLDNKPNQVHTRSLHAEENAFLQIVKYGGEGIRGGKLFVTASPCELCSKKSYQLGIREIYYIDPYPGISKDHILTFGKEGNPKLILYNGVIGSAYEKLYSRIIPLKDELELITEVNDKAVATNLYVDERIQNNSKYVEYTEHSLSMTFLSRSQIQCVRKTAFRVIDKSIDKLFFGFGWTGNMIESVSSLSDECVITKYDIVDNRCTFEAKLQKTYNEGDVVSLEIQINLRDDRQEMNRFLSMSVANPIEKLGLALKVKKDIFGVENVVVKRYYDFVNNKTLGRDIELKDSGDGEYYEYKYYTRENEEPIVNYTYSLEWDEVKT